MIDTGTSLFTAHLRMLGSLLHKETTREGSPGQASDSVALRLHSAWLSMSPDSGSDLVSTLELVDRARLGDAGAIERLFARHFPPLRRWARGRLPVWARDLADTDDVVQEALLRTFRRIEDVDLGGAGSLQAYLRQAVMNRIRDELRHRKRIPEMVEVDVRQIAEVNSPLEDAIGAEALRQYDEALARLKPDEREAIVARVEMGYTYEELAESLGKPSWDAARKTAKRALVRLAQEMARGRS